MMGNLIRAHWIFALLVLPGIAAGQDSSVADVGLRYLNTLYAFEFDQLGAHLAEDATFRDPTAATLVGSPLAYQGRDAIVSGFAAGAADSRNARFEVLHSFASGEYVVFSLIYRTELRGDPIGVPGQWVGVEVSGNTILRVTNGLVSEHVDHVDYEELLRQVEAARGASGLSLGSR